MKCKSSLLYDWDRLKSICRVNDIHWIAQSNQDLFPGGSDGEDI